MNKGNGLCDVNLLSNVMVMWPQDGGHVFHRDMVLLHICQPVNDLYDHDLLLWVMIIWSYDASW